MVLAGMLVLGDGLRARHEIPVDITVRIYIRPSGDRMDVLVRVPLRAMRDMDFPLRGPGYLQIDLADEELRNAAQLWLGDEMKLFEEGDPVTGQAIAAVRASIPSNQDFGSFDRALAHINSPPLPADTDLHWQNAFLDIHFTYDLKSEDSRFSIAPNLMRLAERVSTVLRFVSPDGSEKVLQYLGDPGEVSLDPSWYQAAGRFTVMGFEHILDGLDHLLFLLCLVIPFRKLRSVILIATAFTVAHSITLIASAFGLAPNALWFPPLIETLIATSIVYMAVENILGATPKRRWVIAFGFGLVHGFGFSFALQQSLQFAGTHLLASLLAFNLGVELGQILVLLLIIPALELAFRFGVAERAGTILLSVLVAHVGWHWMSDRATVLSEYDRPWWALAAGWPWLVLAVGVAITGWVVIRKDRARSASR